MLTNKDKLSLWLYPTDDDIRPIVGYRFAFSPRSGRAADRIECTVVAAEVGRQLSYTWRPSDSEPVSVVSWRLEPIDGGTRVHLRHDGALPGSAVPRLSASLIGDITFRRQRRSQLARGRHQFQGALQWL